MAVIILHRPVCILISSYYCHWYCICSCRYALRRTATQGSSPASQARLDPELKSSRPHAQGPQAAAPSSLERRPSAGLTAAQELLYSSVRQPSQPASSCAPRAVILTAARPLWSLARTSRSGMVMQPPQMSGIGSGVSSSFRARLAQTAHGDMPSVTHSLPPAPAVACRQHKISC